MSRLEGVGGGGELASVKQELVQPASCSGSPLPTGRGRRRSCPCGLGLYSGGLASLVAAQVRPGKLQVFGSVLFYFCFSISFFLFCFS